MNNSFKKKVLQKSVMPNFQEIVTFLRSKPHLLKNERNNYSAEK